jgi:hypothetical protein
MLIKALQTHEFEVGENRIVKRTVAISAVPTLLKDVASWVRGY